MDSLRKAKYLETEFTLRQLLRGPSVDFFGTRRRCELSAQAL
jgi:hypothetical protein